MVLKTLFGKKGPAAKLTLTQQGPEIKSETPAASDPISSPNQNEPPSATFLEQAMVDNARTDTPESRTKVYQELLFSDLLLTMADLENENPNQNGDDSQTAKPFNVAILTNSQGTPFCAAFSSVVAARRWRSEGGHFAGVRGQDLFKLLESSPAEVLVINPGNAPFIVLQKVEFRQLALGVIPQTPYSPVQVGVGEAPAAIDPNQTKIAFPPGVFSDDQKLRALEILKNNENIEAAAVGAILPPGADEQSGWVRTVFLRVKGIDENPQDMQTFCMNMRSSIVEDSSIFEQTPFEVGVMPDPSFWQAMHDNNIILFDKMVSLST